MKIQTLMDAQKEFSHSGEAKGLAFRKEKLRFLQSLLKKNEQILIDALYEDLKKSPFETYFTELALVHHEIKLILKNLDQWASPKKVKNSLLSFPSKAFLIPEPYGNVLIISPWNYPYQLSFSPLIAAIAAGNTSLLKPSELAPYASQAMAELINSNFDSSYLHVVEGGVKISQELLTHRFDKIFFTGGTAIAKIVAKAAAEHLTPLTLELGGKCPCFVFADTDLKRSAQRIVWGKFLNAGQTCLAPDYLLVQDSIYDEFLVLLKKQIQQQLGKDPLSNPNYGRIIHAKHLSRLERLINPQQVYSGGKIVHQDNYLEPTLLQHVNFNDPIMQEEIFGPILPVLRFSDLKMTLETLQKLPRPLGLYVFSKSQETQDRIINTLSFGGGCINDVLVHISNFNLPFGGVGDSGMGSYHGEAGFRCFSHYKSILKKSFLPEPPFRYPPHSKLKWKIIRKLFE